MIAASAAAALAEVICTQPLDTAKVRMQTGHSLRAPASWMWQGTGIRAAGIIQVRIVFWSTMDVMMEQGLHPALAGGIAGCAQTVVDTPVEAAKISRMTGGAPINLRTMWRGASWTLSRNAAFAATVCAGRSSTDTVWGAPAGAIVGAVITHPLDTLKSRAQASTALSSGSLWSGLLPRCAVVAMAMLVGSAVFDAAKMHSDRGS